MKIDIMDQLLIDIYNIRNLEYVNFWDLHGTSDSKILVIPAIMINYDGGKTLNLCSKDKYHFNHLNWRLIYISKALLF